MSRYSPVISLCCLGAVLIGCSGRGYSGDKRFPLSGKVTYNGEPLDLGTISFLPLSGDKQRVSGGVIENGAYKIPEDEGANAGKYRVEVRWAKKTGKQFKDRELEMMVDERKEGLPPRFHDQSELSADVAADRTVFDFELK
jgi:hypothetical protein